MSRRRQIISIVAILATLGAAQTLILWQPWKGPPLQLKVENFEAIRNGMTRIEVEDLLGGPPGNYGRYQKGRMTLEGFLSPPGSTELIWTNDSARLEIYFDNGLVVAKHRRRGYSTTPK